MIKHRTSVKINIYFCIWGKLLVETYMISPYICFIPITLLCVCYIPSCFPYILSLGVPSYVSSRNNKPHLCGNLSDSVCSSLRQHVYSLCVSGVLSTPTFTSDCQFSHQDSDFHEINTQTHTHRNYKALYHSIVSVMWLSLCNSIASCYNL